jgi:hypothetical protein
MESKNKAEILCLLGMSVIRAGFAIKVEPVRAAVGELDQPLGVFTEERQLVAPNRVDCVRSRLYPCHHTWRPCVMTVGARDSFIRAGDEVQEEHVDNEKKTM